MDDKNWHPSMWETDLDERASGMFPKTSECTKCGRKTWEYATRGTCRGCEHDERERENKEFWKQQQKWNEEELQRMRERGELEIEDDYFSDMANDR